jgi:hypothetical protein
MSNKEEDKNFVVGNTVIWKTIHLILMYVPYILYNLLSEPTNAQHTHTHTHTHTHIYILLSIWGPSAYASGSTSALWLIMLSSYWTFKFSPPVFRAATPPKQRNVELWPCNLYLFQLSPIVVFERDPSSQRWNYVGERWLVNLAWRCPTST